MPTRLNRFAGSRGRLLVVLALVVGAVGYVGWQRTRRATIPQSPTAATSLTFEALVDSAAGMGARFRQEMTAIPEDDDARRLQATVDYLKSVTSRYYDWAIAGGAFQSAEKVNRDYVLPAVEAVLEARPEIAAGRAGLPSSAVVRLYFLDQGMFLAHGVVYGGSGVGRFPSLELAPIVKETTLDREVWGRWIDAVAFAIRDPAIVDIVSYANGVSTGGNMVTMGTIVCHHLEREAEFVRSLRNQIRHAHHGTPSPALDSNAMMERLAYVALQPYMSLDEDGAVAAFMPDWRETSYVHELGHIFSKQAGLALAAQSGEEEALAYLTELRYGGLPHYTLYNMFSVGEIQGVQPHREGTRIVFAEFARLIRDAKSRGHGFDEIDVTAAESSTNDGIDRIAYQFSRLQADEIRALAARVFEQTYPRVSEHP